MTEQSAVHTFTALAGQLPYIPIPTASADEGAMESQTARTFGMGPLSEAQTIAWRTR